MSMSQKTDLELAEEIDRFIAQHAKISGAYDPDFDDPSERFNGPDSALLESAAIALRQGQEPPRVHSTWGSGCYRPTSGDPIAVRWHDCLVKAVNDRDYALTASSPRPGAR